MIRYKIQTRPGLGTLYDIQPANGAGLFLQPRSPHGAKQIKEQTTTKIELTTCKHK